MRIFASITPPEDTLSYLEKCIAELSHHNKRMPITWSDKSILHSTVLFIGDIEETILPDIIKIVDAAVLKITQFYIHMTTTEIQFKKEKPHLIYMKLYDASGTFQKFHESLVQEISSIIPLEKSTFMPHITLGKIKKGRGLKRKVNIETSHIDALFPVESIDIIESTLTAIGPMYKRLHTSKINNG